MESYIHWAAFVFTFFFSDGNCTFTFILCMKGIHFIEFTEVNNALNNSTMCIKTTGSRDILCCIAVVSHISGQVLMSSVD